MTRDGGGGRVKGGDQSRRNWAKWRCANARVSARGAVGGARGPE
jgi:hypothetical protein